MTETPPLWVTQVPNYPGLHNFPARAGTPFQFPLTWQQLQQIVTALVNEFMRQVALALGAIEVFGFNAYAALVEIGERLQAAKENWDTFLGLLSVGDVAGAVGYMANLTAEGLYNAAAGFQNLGDSILRNLDGLGRFASGQLIGHLTAGWEYTIDVALLVDSATQVFQDGLYDAAKGFANAASSPLKWLVQAGEDLGKFDAAALLNLGNIPSGIPYASIESILEQASLGDDIEALKNNINTALAGANGTLADVVTNLQTIPPPNIQSIWSLTSLDEDLQAVVNNITQATQGISATLGQNVASIVPNLQSIATSVFAHFW